jgi:DNA-directed RNA polymerase subunit RPC12/RpoP
MPIRRSDSGQFYICLECGSIRNWNGNVSCRTCGGKIIGPVNKETAEAASRDPNIKQRIIQDNKEAKKARD